MKMLNLTASLSIMMACAASPSLAQSPAEKRLAATAAALHIQREAARYQSQDLIDKALEAKNQGRFADALELATSAHRADGSNPAAQSLKQELETLLVGNDSSMMSRQLDRLSVESQIQAHQASLAPAGLKKTDEVGKNSGKGPAISENKSQERRKAEKTPVPSVNDRAIIQRQKDIQERMAMEFENHLNDADELMIPYRGLVNYPDDWAGRADIRDRQTAAQRQPIGQ